MNNRDLLKAIGDIDDNYLIGEIKEENNRIIPKIRVGFMKNLKLKYILAPICIALIAIIGLYESNLFTSKPDIVISNNDDWIIKEVYYDGKIENSIAVIPKWDEMSISQQFMEVQYNNSKYSTRVTEISNDNIGENIGTANLVGHDIYTDTYHNKKGELYAIKNIAEKCAIAVKFEGDINYYVYVNSYYRPTTLGEFMEDLDLKEITSFGTICYDYWDKNSEGDIEYKNIEFYDVDDEIIWQKLFNNPNLENIYSDNDTGKYMSERYSVSISISVDIPLLGYKNIGISLTDKGYLLTNILDTGKGFYIGEDKVQEFLNYIKENYAGYQIVYVDENSEDMTDEENNIVEDKIIMMENKIKDTTVIDTVTTIENRVEASEKLSK